MKSDRNSLLDRATQALRDEVPAAAAEAASMERTARLLGVEAHADVANESIQNCEGIRRLFDAYRAGTLPAARGLLVKAHLHDCGVCLRQFHEGEAALDWSVPRIAASASGVQRPQLWAWAFATAAALLVAVLVGYRLYWQVPPGVRAEVVSTEGAAFLDANGTSRTLQPGAVLREHDQVRTAGDSRVTLRLSDGSLVELNQRSHLAVGARGRNMTVALNQGAVIVQAAHRTAGHLYVRTPDCRVAVTGTVFSVDAGLKGSRVAVLQGSVHVSHGGADSILSPGQQLATSDNLAPEPLQEQFSWSADRQKYIGIVAQLALVEHRIAQIPFPGPRYSSDLLNRMPSNTMLYVSVPNLGEFLAQANAVFNDQLNQSPELQQWWTQRHQGNPDALNEIVAKIHDISGYLGNEVVIVGMQQQDRSTGALVADVQKSGLADELRRQFADVHGKSLTVLDEASLANATGVPGAYALVRDHEVIFSGNVATLRQLDAQFNAGSSGFAASDFGQRITAAYSRGAGIILAANLQAMLQQKQLLHGPHSAARDAALESSGLSGVQYLIAEHRETNGDPVNHLNLQFSGARRRIASWLGTPAPIGSLDFVSPNASIAVAALTKDPASIADDLLAMVAQKKGAPLDWNQIDSKLQISLRDDLMANLNGDFLAALDGPVLPTPSWKLVIGVNNPAALETALERALQAIGSETTDSRAPHLRIESAMDASRTIYSIQDDRKGITVAQYTYVDGFLVMAPNRAMLMDALQVEATGNSLAHSASFRSLLPRDQNENYSAVAYQNLSPVISPLLSTFSGDTADALRKLAADARPTVICAWGEDNRIEAASDSRLFGFDFLTLQALVHSRNQSGAGLVQR